MGEICCGQAMVIHGTAHSLEELGIEELPATVKTSFSILNEAFIHATSPLGRAFRFFPQELGIEALLHHGCGGWGVHVYHFNAEDIVLVNSDTVRSSYEESGVEAIPHFIHLNLDTNVIFLNPEVVFLTKEERQHPRLFLQRMRRPPYLLVFDTSAWSSSNIWALGLECRPRVAQESNYNDKPALKRKRDELVEARRNKQCQAPRPRL